MQADNAKKKLESQPHVMREKAKNKRLSWFFAGVAAVFVVLIIWAAASSGDTPSRTESYKKGRGAAGLEAVISYDCHKCKQSFNFNVYIMGKDGQQVAVVQPNKDGKVNLALPEGEYVMLLGKQLGKDKLFPQESITLRGGQILELKLHYKEGGL